MTYTIRVSFFMLMLLLPLFILAQTKPKQVEKPPTQKEMQQMMKEMQQSMDEMTEEEKKEMEKMGIKMPDMKALQKTVSGVSDAQLKKAFDDDNRIVPEKDVKRIAAIPPTPSKSGLLNYITNLQNALSSILSENDIKDAETVYQMAKTNNYGHLGNAAIGLWIGKYPVLAVYLMGKACIEEPEDINNINNYAAMLSMLGAEHVSLPILQNLNAQFPGNSTVLNNLGQAWFGLGDILKSEKHLDSAIRIYPFHSQANLTKSKIEESKGNTAAAAEAVKRSIKTAYSVEKENQIKKFGKDISSKDIDWPFPMPQDPLGLHRFTWPPYPQDVSQSRLLEIKWNDFKEQCSNAIAVLSAKRDLLEKQSEEESERREKHLLAAGANANINDVIPPFTAKAILKLGHLVNDKDGGHAYKSEKLTQDMVKALKLDAELQAIESAGKKAVSEKYNPLIGEGKPNPTEAYCNEYNAVSNKYLAATNKNLEETQKAWLDFQLKRTNDMVHYSQYTIWPAHFELLKVEVQIAWLNTIEGQTIRFRSQGPFCDIKKTEKPPGTELAEFDDVACKYQSTMDLHVIKLISSCSRLEGILDLGPIKYSRKDDVEKDKLIAASLTVTVGAKKGWEKGPVTAEVKATMSGTVEWNETRITDWIFKSEVGVSVGSNMGYGDKSIEVAGAEASIGMNGSAVKGKGVLQTINITNKW